MDVEYPNFPTETWMPRLGFASEIVEPSDDIRAAVDWAVENDLRVVELSGFHYWPDLLSAEDVNWMVQQAGAHDIVYTIHFPVRAAPSAHHTERWNGYLAQMKETIKLAGQINAPVIVFHPGVIDCPGIERENATEALRKDAVENLLRHLREVEGLARDAGTVICLENLHQRAGDVIRSYQHLVEIVDVMDSPNIKITLDIGHAHIHDGIPDAIEAFGDRLHHLQVHDALEGRDHKEIGTGEITPDYYADLIKNEKVGLVVIETSARRGGVPALLRSRDVLKAHFGDSLT